VTSNLEKNYGLVHCSVKNAAVLCETNVKESRKFELARLKKKKKKNKKNFWLSGDFLVWCTGCVVCHENTRR